MAGAAAAANFVGFGILFSFGLFLTPLTDHFEASTAAVASVFSGSVLCYYLAGAVGGSLGDRFGARPVVVFGAVTLPLGLAAASVAGELWLLAALYVPFVGLAVGSCYAPLIGAVGRALPAARGLAIGVVLTGVGAGTLVFPLIIRGLLDRGDWQTAFRTLAVVSGGVLVVTAVAVVDPGRRDGGGGRGAATVLRRMVASTSFRRLYASVVLIAPGFYAPLAFLNDYAVDRGATTDRAALLVGSIGLGSVVTRLGFGALATRVGPLRQYLGSHVVFLAAMAAWFAAGDRYEVLVIAAVAHGVAWAAWVTAAPLVLAGWFGLDDLGLAVGGFYTGLGVGAVIGPPVTGAVIDRAGDRPAIALLIATTAASVVLVARSQREPVSSPRR